MLKTCTIFSLVIICLFLQACTTTTGREAPTIRVKNILVLPTQVGHPELNSFQSKATRAFEKELRSEGFNTIKLSNGLYQQAHNLALEKTGSVYDPKLGMFTPMNKPAYAKEMLYLLLSKKNFDLMLFPSILLRQADVNKEKGTAEFDGISKKLTFADGVSNKVYPDIARGLSLKVVGITREQVGTRAFSAGISLPFDISEGIGGMTITLKTELITDKELDDAIERVTELFTEQVKPD